MQGDINYLKITLFPTSVSLTLIYRVVEVVWDLWRISGAFRGKIVRLWQTKLINSFLSGTRTLCKVKVNSMTKCFCFHYKISTRIWYSSFIPWLGREWELSLLLPLLPAVLLFVLLFVIVVPAGLTPDLQHFSWDHLDSFLIVLLAQVFLPN